MWGQVSDIIVSLRTSRIIPTRVGTSIPVDHLLTVAKDHPHACGDKYPSSAVPTIGIGSSPRVWGQDSVNGLLRSLIRIIPTRVGTRVVEIAINHRL